MQIKTKQWQLSSTSSGLPHLWLDFYNSPQLAKILKSKGIEYISMLCTNNRNVLSSYMIKQTRWESIAVSIQGMLEYMPGRIRRHFRILQK
jgi:hypothetical protein